MNGNGMEELKGNGRREFSGSFSGGFEREFLPENRTEIPLGCDFFSGVLLL